MHLAGTSQVLTQHRRSSRSPIPEGIPYDRKRDLQNIKQPLPSICSTQACMPSILLAGNPMRVAHMICVSSHATCIQNNLPRAAGVLHAVGAVVVCGSWRASRHHGTHTLVSYAAASQQENGTPRTLLRQYARSRDDMRFMVVKMLSKRMLSCIGLIPRNHLALMCLTAASRGDYDARATTLPLTIRQTLQRRSRRRLRGRPRDRL